MSMLETRDLRERKVKNSLALSTVHRREHWLQDLCEITSKRALRWGSERIRECRGYHHRWGVQLSSWIGIIKILLSDRRREFVIERDTDLKWETHERM